MRRFFAAFVAAILSIIICSSSAYAKEYTISPEKFSAYILTEVSTGTVLEEYNADTPVSSGYLSKLMTLLLVAEDMETGKFSPDTVMTASDSVSGVKGAVIWLEPGEQITVDELIKGVVTGNANDAAIVLAEGCEQTAENFVSRMNSEAFDLGLRSTTFHSPCGYSDSGDMTTARELAVICRRLAKCSNILPYFGIWRDFVRDGKTELVSENTLTRTYKRHIGFKECHGEETGCCIAEGGRDEHGTAYIAVVLGGEDSECTEKAAKKLIDHAFAAYRVAPLMFPDEMMKPLSVRYGTESAVEVRINGHGSAVLPKSSGEPYAAVVLPQYLTAPVRKGQSIGTVAFYDGKTLVYETQIVTADSIERLSFDFIAKKMLNKMLK